MISVVINALNEEKNLPRALASLKGFADEIVVVDMESEDKTREIALSKGAVVFSHKRMGYVEPARNYAIEKASGDWIFILDADEELPDSLAQKLEKLSQSGEADYYRIPRKNINFGKWMKHSRWWPDYNIRFFKKGCVVWDPAIHSIPITQGKGADLEAKEDLAIIHHNYVSVEKYIERLNRYTSIQAKELIKKGYVFSWHDCIRKPLAEFLSRYFAGEGYKDGLHGLVFSFLQAFSELVVYLKVWQEQDFKESNPPLEAVGKELLRVEKETKWWMIEADKNKTGLIKSIAKKLYRRLFLTINE